MSLPNLHTTDEAAAILRTSPSMVRKLIRRKELDAVKRRRQWWVTDEGITKYLGMDRVAS